MRTVSLKENYTHTAIVKDIPDGTWAKSNKHADTFVMGNMIGKTIRLYPREEKGWYYGEDMYSYHSSWLKSLKKLSPTSKVKKNSK